MQRQLNPHCSRFVEVARQAIALLPDNDIRAAFLFGSTAWGDADEASDLDIMLLLDRPRDFREVTRIRLADLFGHALPDGPVFADLDRISVERFAEVIEKGGWAHRVVHSIILKDTDQYYESIRARVGEEYATPGARQARFLTRRERAEAERAAMREALPNDLELAALHARLRLEAAATAIVELNDEHLSIIHFLPTARHALRKLGHEHLFEPLVHLLALDGGDHAIDRSLHAYQVFADTLKAWMQDPAVAGQLSHEDLAWATFTYEPRTYEEIFHKVGVYRRLGHLPALLFYLDGLLTVPIRLNVGKILLVRTQGASGLISLPDFQRALRAEPALLAEWIAALRLDIVASRVQEADELTARLLAAGEAALAHS